MQFGETIRRLRAARGLKQFELAKRAGVSQPYIAMLERGDRTYPSLPVLLALASALKVEVPELLPRRRK